MSYTLFVLKALPFLGLCLLLGMAQPKASIGACSIEYAWKLYRQGSYAEAKTCYGAVHREQPQNLDAMHGWIETSAYLHQYGEAMAWCDSLQRYGVLEDVVKLKKEWVRSLRTMNRQFGFSLLGGPMVYSHQALGTAEYPYTYDRGRYAEAEAWLVWNQKQTFAVTLSRFDATFQVNHPDSLWFGVQYLDTLYASLGQAPRTNQFISNRFVNVLGDSDTWYSDYSSLPLGASAQRPQGNLYDTLISVGQSAYRPAAIEQNQIRLGWSEVFAKWSLGLALTVGESNILGQNHYGQVWTKQGFSLPWLDLVLQESFLQMDEAAFLQVSPRLIRGWQGVLFEINPSWVGQINRDTALKDQGQQFFLEAKAYQERRHWSWSLAGTWGPKAYATTEEGRSIANLELDHRQSYSISMAYKPWVNHFLKLYGVYKWEDYAHLKRQLAFLGVAYSW